MTAATSIHRWYLRQAVRKYARILPSEALLLDAGSGYMPYRGLFKSLRCISLEISRYSKPLIQADICSLPLRDRVTDAVFCTEVLEHIAKPAQALQEIWRVLKAKGYLFISVPFLVGVHYDSCGDYYRWNEFGLRELLMQNRFEVISIYPLGGPFSAIAEAMLAFPTEFFSPPSRFQKTIISVPFYLAQTFGRIILLLPAIALSLLDSIYRRRNYAIGYAVIGRKVG